MDIPTRFEDDYPIQARWLMDWYRTGRRLPGLPEKCVYWFSCMGGWQIHRIG